jgi:hypothetical protein
MPIFNYPFRIPPGYSVAKPVVPVIIVNPENGFDYSTWALIDTGADTTVIPEDIAKTLYHDVRNPRAKRDKTFGIGGEVDVYMHTFSIKILFSDPAGKIDHNRVAIKIPKRTFAVVPNLHIVILGEQDFLKNYVLTINYPRQIFSIKKPTKK